MVSRTKGLCQGWERSIGIGEKPHRQRNHYWYSGVSYLESARYGGSGTRLPDCPTLARPALTCAVLLWELH